jgi:predicted cupin superfamily sugar epimerase/uncharacterized protein (DUF952 family)
METACIFHICDRETATVAIKTGVYRAPSLESEGFIHFSRAQQVPWVAKSFYEGQTRLALMVVDPALLVAPLRIEAPSPAPIGATPNGANAQGAPHNQFFPHLYGALNTDAIIDLIDLERFEGKPIHPDTQALLRQYRFDRLPVEGTLYKSTWHSAHTVPETGGPTGTAMIGLYTDSPSSVSCFHRLAYDEVWHFYGGDPLALYLLHADGRTQEVHLGGDSGAGELPQFVVAAGVWQAGEMLPGGRHSLFGCTMSPGFTGPCFEAGLESMLVAGYPELATVIRRLSVNGNEIRMPRR